MAASCDAWPVSRERREREREEGRPIFVGESATTVRGGAKVEDEVVVTFMGEPEPLRDGGPKFDSEEWWGELRDATLRACSGLSPEVHQTFVRLHISGERAPLVLFELKGDGLEELERAASMRTQKHAWKRAEKALRRRERQG